MSLNTLFNLDGRVIVVTDDFKHLGKVITESLLVHGAIVWVIGCVIEKKHDLVFEQTKKKGKPKEGANEST